MRKIHVALVVILIATLGVYPCHGTVGPKPKPPVLPSSPLYFNLYQPLAKTHIAQAEALLQEASGLLDTAMSEGKQVESCKALLEEARTILEEAKTVNNYLYANNLALKALSMIQEAMGCLK